MTFIKAKVAVRDFAANPLLPLSAAYMTTSVNGLQKETSNGEINGLSRGNVYYETVDLHVGRTQTTTTLFLVGFPLDGCSHV